jgi:hypothetical protein
VINSNNVSRRLGFAYQISVDNFEKIKSFSTFHFYSLCCKCSPISSERSLSVARRRCDETFGLWQCCASWFTELTASPSPVHSSRSSAYTSLRFFHRHFRQFSLAAINSANSVQAGDHRLPVTARHSAQLPGCYS